MRIEIHHIPSQGATLQFRKGARQFSTLKELRANGECDFITPMEISLSVVPEKDFFKVAGRIAVTLRLECARCLTEFDAPLNHRFTLNYSHQILDDIHASGSDGVELTAQQIGMYYFEGQEIDFTDAVQEQVVLAIPYRPLCDPACKGLCAGCGADLNKAACQCNVKAEDGPFAVLRNLKLS